MSRLVEGVDERPKQEHVSTAQSATKLAYRLRNTLKRALSGGGALHSRSNPLRSDISCSILACFLALILQLLNNYAITSLVYCWRKT